MASGQKSSGVAILMSLQECRFFLHITVHREINSGMPQVKKRGLRSPNTIQFYNTYVANTGEDSHLTFFFCWVKDKYLLVLYSGVLFT